MKIFKGFASFWRWYKGLYEDASLFKKLFVFVLTVVITILLYSLAVIFNFLWLFGKSPSLQDILHPRQPVASEILSDDGHVIGKIYDENRTPVSYEEIAPSFFDALISTEDERFYEHHGIDFMGILAATKDAFLGRARGASTISQQLVKNHFHIRTKYSTGLLGYIPGVKILVMKSKEMIIATEIEMLSTKKEILEMYANTVDFGSNAYGIKTAARMYFNKTPDKLKVEEVAVLVGLLKATSTYNPKLNPKRSLERRNVVLENMRSHGYLTREECDSLKELPIELDFHGEDPNDGEAQYFREVVKKELADVLPEYDPYTEGLKIYTTIDSRMQHYAELAVKEKMRQNQINFFNELGGGNPWSASEGGFLDKRIRQTDSYKILAARFPDEPDSVRYYLNKPHEVKLFDYMGGKTAVMSTMDSLRYMLKYLHTGFIAMEPETGYVKAYVGDVDFKTWQHDNVQATHQPGSTFKLFVYTTAIKQNLSLNFRIPDSPLTYNGKEWPRNAGAAYTHQELTMRQGFAKSLNTIAARLGQQVGVANVEQTAYDLGITTQLDASSLSMCLGSSDVKVIDLVSSYCTVANNGVHVKPMIITRVLDSHGREVYRAGRKEERVLDKQVAHDVQQLLAASVNEGTSMAFGSDAYLGQWYHAGRIDLGGKTGTTNDNTDSWFVGVSPGLVAGAWVGGEYRQIHFRSGANGQGARAALPIVGKFFYSVLCDARLSGKYLKCYNPLPMTSPDTFQPDSLMVDSTFSDSLYMDGNDSTTFIDEEANDTILYM